MMTPTRTTSLTQHLPMGYGAPQQQHFGSTAAASPMDLDGGMTWPSLDHQTTATWTSMAPLPAALLAQYPSLARMSWSPAAASPSADPFSAIESLFDFDSGTTGDAAGSRTPGAGSAYTKWWSSYTDASSGMKAQEHGEDHPDPGQYR